MKILRSTVKPDGRRGSATLVVLTLLSIMVIFEAAEFAATRHLSLDLRLIEQRQIQRLKPPQPKPAPGPRENQPHG